MIGNKPLVDEGSSIKTIQAALADLRDGKFVLVTDDASRENEGDLIMAAELVTAEAVTTMVREACGLVCVPVGGERLTELGLPPMVSVNGDPHGTAFSVSVDHLDSGTGISAADRALTIRALADPRSRAADFRRPGHIFPLAAKAGGVLRRRGHTEAAVDLMRLAGLRECAVICEILNPDGTMARGAQLDEFAQKLGIRMLSIAELVHYRLQTESTVIREAVTTLPTRYGVFTLYAYREIITGKEQLALTLGDITAGKSTLCRLHSECLTGDVFGSLRCDCGEQLDMALRRVAQAGTGVVLYLRQEGRGIGLANKIKAYQLQDDGLDTLDANLNLGFAGDERDYSAAAHILKDLGVSAVDLLTNNPEKTEGLTAAGIEIASRVALETIPTEFNKKYLHTKKTRMRHILTGATNESV